MSLIIVYSYSVVNPAGSGMDRMMRPVGSGLASMAGAEGIGPYRM